MSRFPGALLCTAILALAVVGAAHISSCYSPPTPDCGFSCNNSNNFECPPDYTCAMADQTCKLNTAPQGMRCQSDAAPDLTPKDANQMTPMVSAHTPADGATNVSRTDAITATFSRAVVQPDATDFLVMDGPVTLPGTYGYDGSSNTASFTPSPPLPGGHTITVTLTSDIHAQSAPSPIMQTSWSFTTIDDEPPQLAVSNPLDTQTMVPITSTIVMTFSEPVSFPMSAISVSSGATGILGTLTTADNQTYTFTPTLPLPAASTITVVLSSAIVDMAVPPNALLATQFSFMTQ